MMPFMAPMMMGGSASAVVATTWDTVSLPDNVTLSADKLTITGPSQAKDSLARATTYRSAGKLYFEGTLIGGALMLLGVCNASALKTDSGPGANANSVGYYPGGGTVYPGVGSAIGVPTASAGDVIGVAVDFSLSKVWFLKNGVSLSGSPASGTGGFNIPSGALAPAVDAAGSGTSTKANFGASAFASTPPSGFLPWG